MKTANCFNKSAQAMVELAVIGALVVFAVAMLIRFTMQGYYQLSAGQEAFRMAMRETRRDPCLMLNPPGSRVPPPPGDEGKACRDDPECPGWCKDGKGNPPFEMIAAYGAGTVIQVRDRRMPELGSPVPVGARSPIVSSASASWGNEVVDYRVTQPDSLPRLTILVNNEAHRFAGVGYLTEEFQRVGASDTYLHVGRGKVYSEDELMELFCRYEDIFGNGKGSSGTVKLEGFDQTGALVQRPWSLDPSPDGEPIKDCSIKLSVCPASGHRAQMRGSACDEVTKWRMRALDGCSAEIINGDSCEAQCAHMNQVDDPKPPQPWYCDKLDQADKQGFDFGNFVRELETNDQLARQESGSQIVNTVAVNETESIKKRTIYTWKNDPNCFNDCAGQVVINQTFPDQHTETWSTDQK